MDQESAESENEKHEDAALGARRASGEPIRALNGAVQKSAHAEKAAVGRAVEKSFGPVPGCMESKREPEISGAAESET